MTERKDTIPRLAEEWEAPGLKSLWKTVFGDGDADIQHFFETYFSPDLTTVIDDGSGPVSAAYILPVGDLVLPECRRLPCAMLYAIATLPEHRGLGYGEAVTRAAAAQAARLGYPAVVLKPADDGLFNFYEKRTDFREFFEVCENEYAGDDLPISDKTVGGKPEPGAPQYALSPVSPAEYRRLRQKFLDGAAYIDMDERALAYQQYLCEQAGGGLYTLLDDGRCVGCAVIEPDGGTVTIKELLLSPGNSDAAAVAAAARLIPAENYAVRTVPGTGSRCTRRFGMMVPAGVCPNVPYVYSAKWYGLAFD